LTTTYEEIERPIYVTVEEPIFEWLMTEVEKYAPNWLVNTQIVCYIVALLYCEKVQKTQVPNILGFVFFLIWRAIVIFDQYETKREKRDPFDLGLITFTCCTISSVLLY